MNQKELNNLINQQIDKIGIERLFNELIQSASYWAQYYGFDPNKSIEGHSLADIASKALEKVVLQEWKWKPELSNLKTYLKNQVIKGLFRNLKVKGKIEVQGEIDSETSGIFEEQVTEDMDNAIYLDYIEKYFEDDNDVMNILLGKMEGYKRKEIIEEFNMTDSRYNSAIKRFGNKIKHVREFALVKQLKDG